MSLSVLSLRVSLQRRNSGVIMLIIAPGTTVPYGSAIMTGTPAGVGWSRSVQSPSKDGDVLEVEIQPIGKLKNKIVFEK